MGASDREQLRVSIGCTEWVEPLNGRMVFGKPEIAPTQVIGKGEYNPELSNTEPYVKMVASELNHIDEY